MGKPKKTAAEDEAPVAQGAAPVEVGDVIYVNRDKFNRAKIIVALVSGAKVPANDSEADRKDKMVAQFAAAEVSPKGEDALRFAYEHLLGGLVRTPAEQEDADKESAAMRKKFNKKKVEEDKAN